MAGVARRIKRERARVWEWAMLTRMEKPPTLEQYTGEKTRAEPASFLDLRLRASTKGLRSMTMAEYRKSLN